MESRSDKKYPNSKLKIQQKIRFLEEQLISLDHYLPETYDYLMQELDIQRRLLVEHEVLETYSEIDGNNTSDE